MKFLVINKIINDLASQHLYFKQKNNARNIFAKSFQLKIGFLILCMDNIEIILTQTGTIILLLFIYYLIKNFWPKYFEAKATNQATKEDIGEITKIAESIKTELAKSTEVLKANLSLTNNQILNFKSAESDAMFDYHKKLSAWLFYLIRLNPSKYDLENYKDIKKEKSQFSKRQYKCDLAEAHLTLFMHDQKFLDIKRKLTINIIKYEGELSKTLSRILFQHSELDLEISIAKSDQIPVLRISIYAKIKPILEKYDEESKKQFQIIHNLHVELRLLINERLKLLNAQL